MEQIVRTDDRIAVANAQIGIVSIGAIIATAGLVFAWSATTWFHFFEVALPYRQLEIPVLWWAVFGAYAWFVSRVAGRRREPLYSLFVDFLLLHLVWLMIQLWIDVPLARALGTAYAVYIYAVVAVFLILTAARAGQVLDRVVNARPDSSGVIRLPILFGSAIALTYAAMHRQPVVVAIGVLGIAIGYWTEPLRDKIGGLQYAVPRWCFKPEAILVAILVLAFAVRVAWYVHLVGVVGYSYESGFLAASDDGQTYHGSATAIASHLRTALLGHANPAISSSFDPLYPILMGIWYAAFGVHFAPVVIMQSLLGMLMVIPMYNVGCRLANGNKLGGLVAAAGVAISQPLIFSSAVYGIEALYIPVLVFWVWLTFEWLEGRDHFINLLLLGICGGIILGLRRFAPLMVLAALIAGVCWGTHSSVWRRIRQAVIIFVLSLAVYAPIEMMYFQNGTTRLVPQIGAHEAGGAMYWESSSAYPQFVPDNQALIRLGIKPFTDVAGTLRSALAHPLAVAAALWHTIPRRVIAFFFWYPFGAFDTVYLVNPAKIPNPFTGAVEFYGAAAVVAGMFWSLSQRSSRRLAGLLLVTIGVQTFVHSILFFTQSIRYSTPVRPYLMAFAAAAIVLFREKAEKSTQ